MEIDILKVHYIIDGKTTIQPTKMFYETLDEDEIQNVHFEVQFNNQQIHSKLHASAEYAVRYFQQVLPNHVRIACCQSCIHGNFNPYGNLENEIFCLKDISPQNKEDVVNFFAKQTYRSRSRKLLDFCQDYKPIDDDEKYTYNDWDL
ncbi:MAG: hypothetical protein ACI33M_10830 [Lysinibacillus sp.]